MAQSPTTRRVADAIKAAGLTQRVLSEATGMSQPMLSRIVTGKRQPQEQELRRIAAATGYTLEELAGTSPVACRAQCAARIPTRPTMTAMHRELLHFLEIDAHLDALSEAP